MASTTPATPAPPGNPVRTNSRPTLEPALAAQVETLRTRVRPRLNRLMGYYRNPATDLAEFLPTRAATLGVRPYRQYQEIGLPSRITGFRCRAGGEIVLAGSVESCRREVVVENDIGWRLHTLVDFAAGQMPVIASSAGDPATRERLTAAIQTVLAASGGVSLLQELVLHGAVHGAAYIALRTEPALRFVALPATRIVPVFAEGEIANSGAPLRACVIADDAAPALVPAGPTGWLGRVGEWVRAAVGVPAAARAPETGEVWTAAHIRRYVDQEIAADRPNPLGFVPVVGYVNQPDAAGGLLPGLGLSEVEPLIPLQDELNTRLSDRANRVTLQSFRMYLAKGIEDFGTRPIGPGTMWATDNPDASITAFGGDAAAPSEEAHINEIREALDKISGVSPVAAGLLRGKIGNLTSAVALRITLIALLARTERKRAGLALTLSAAIRMALDVLAASGAVPSNPADRGVEITWPSALPENLAEKLAEAKLKIDLGVPRSVVLAELGYDAVETHTQTQSANPAGKGDPHGRPHIPAADAPATGEHVTADTAPDNAGDGAGSRGSPGQSDAAPGGHDRLPHAPQILT